MKRDVLLLLLLFAVAVAIVDPRGNFPLDDDWDFALATSHFAHTGRFAFTPFTATSLYAQVVWGAAWIRAFGDSYFVLRCATLALAALTLIAFYALLGRLPLARWQRFLAAASLLFHPIFFWSSFTYMTHVPFVFCTVVALFCYMRGSTALGSAAVVVSFFIRQTGIITCIPAIVMARDRKSRFIAAAPLAAFVIALPSLAHGEFSFHAQPLRAPSHGAMYFFDHFSAAALFTLPLLIPAIRSLKSRAVVLIAMILFIGRALLFMGFANPSWNPILTSTHLFGNVFINLGLGPPTLLDTHLLGFAYPLHLPEAYRAILTMVAAAAGGLLTALLIEKARLEYGYLQVALASGVLALSQLWFDRYTIDATWPLCFLLVLWAPEGRVIPSVARDLGGGRPATRAARFLATLGMTRPSIALLAALAIFDVASVHDYMQWNRDRRAAWDSLVARGVSPMRINGGVELNAVARNAFEQPRPAWEISNEYVLSFRALPGYDVVDHRGRVYALRRQRATKWPPATSNWR